jgi:hypothetical protein
MATNAKTFWLTNISNRNVSLSDLNLTVNAYSTVNLLDSKHYQYTEDQLIKSAQSGSIFKKRDKMVVRKVAVDVLHANVPFNREMFIPCRAKSVLVIKEENYEELNVSDEQFAKESADLIDSDDI